MQLPIFIKAAQHGSSISTATSKACGQKNFFVQGNVNVRNYAGMLSQKGSRLISKVIAATAKARNIGRNIDFALAAAGSNNNLITKPHALHNHANLMVAVLAASQDV